VRQADHDRLPHKLYLFYSNRRPEDAAFLDTLQTLETKNPNFHLICTMTEMSKSNKKWKGETVLIDKEMLSRHLAVRQGPIYCIAGPPTMVAAYAANACRRRGRRGRHSGRRVCRLLRYRGRRSAEADSAWRSGVDFVSLVRGEKL
jgi:NAD(P)H-flavin reductase